MVNLVQSNKRGLCLFVIICYPFLRITTNVPLWIFFGSSYSVVVFFSIILVFVHFAPSRLSSSLIIVHILSRLTFTRSWKNLMLCGGIMELVFSFPIRDKVVCLSEN